MVFMEKYQYRPALLIVLVVFALAAVWNLGYMSVQWDEMPHLGGAVLLSHGQLWDYMTIYGYYPPAFDIVTTGYFQIFGINEVAGRLVAVTFALLAIAVTFELAKKSYGAKNALIASALLATMPGFFWLSRVTMLETMLIFFFTLTMFTFSTWLRDYLFLPLAYWFSKNLKNDFLPENEHLWRWILDDNGLPLRREKNPCTALWISPLIHSNGCVCPCWMDKEEKHPLGDLNKMKFRDIWFGEKYRELRNEFRTDGAKNELCCDCTYAYEGGSCTGETIVEVNFYNK